MPTNADFKPEEKSQCVIWYAETYDIRRVRCLYYHQYGRSRKSPSRQSIKRWYNSFLSTGYVRSPEKRGRKRIIEETVDAIRQHFEANPKLSIRKASRLLCISKSTVHDVVRKKLKKYPYKIMVLHVLKEGDFERRHDFADFVLN